MNTGDWKIQRAILVSLAGSDEGEVGIITVVMALKANETSGAVEHRPGASARRCHQRRPPRCPPPRDRPFQPSAGRRRRRAAEPPALLTPNKPRKTDNTRQTMRLHSCRRQGRRGWAQKSLSVFGTKSLNENEVLLRARSYRGLAILGVP